MSALDDLPTPALILDLDVLERNLTRMSGRAESLGVRLRPHVKSHKCPEIARRQRDRGAAGLTVSTLYEAETFADHGFDDITWAFPVIPSRIDEALALAARIDLGLLIDSRAGRSPHWRIGTRARNRYAPGSRSIAATTAPGSTPHRRRRSSCRGGSTRPGTWYLPGC